MIADYASYANAKRKADEVVAGLAKGKASTLSPGQAADAQNAIEELQRYYVSTGKRVSLRFVVAEWCEAARKLDGRTLAEATDGFMANSARVKRVLVSEAVEKLIAVRKKLTVADEGKRPQLSPEWHYTLSIWWREFAAMFPNHYACDLTRELFTTYMGSFGKVTARTRNGRRTAVKMFVKWCVESDYIGPTHRLFTADGMKEEKADSGEIEFYTPEELRALLEGANGKERFKPLFPVIAIRGQSGVRLKEIKRLDWQDIWRVHDHIEIKKVKAKTRSRRLVEMCPALAAWLESYRSHTGPVWAGTLDHYHDLFEELREELEIPARQNGLRHSFCTYHFALHSNENLTAAQAGNSPGEVHGSYKGLATRKEAEAWFGVAPARPANVIQLGKEKQA